MARPKSFRIRIDLQRLRQNLSAAEGRAWEESEVRAWLIGAGFRPAPDDEWLVREADLGQLDPSEVLSVERVDEDEATC